MYSKVERSPTMPLAKVSTKHQITIPKEVFDGLGLEPGDLLEVTLQNGEGRIIPQQIMAKATAPKLSAAEQKTLKSAQKKISVIANDKLSSRGLTKAEIRVAAKVGLIDPDQAYYWAEEWQKVMRESERDIKAGRVKTFDNVEALVKDLKTA